MVDINLLPWRERVHGYQQRRWCYWLLSCSVGCVLLFAMLHIALNHIVYRDVMALDETKQSHLVSENQESVSNAVVLLQKMRSDQAILTTLLEKVTFQNDDIQFTSLSYERNVLDVMGRARAMPVYLAWVERVSRSYTVKIISIKTQRDSDQLSFHISIFS